MNQENLESTLRQLVGANNSCVFQVSDSNKEILDYWEMGFFYQFLFTHVPGLQPTFEQGFTLDLVRKQRKAYIQDRREQLTSEVRALYEQYGYD